MWVLAQSQDKFLLLFFFFKAQECFFKLFSKIKTTIAQEMDKQHRKEDELKQTG